MRDLATRVRSHAGLKLSCTVVAACVFAAGYVPLGRFPLLAPQTLPLTWVDRVVPFVPGWIVVYHSMYPLLQGGGVAFE